jgi:hypothetical protein
MPPLLIRRKIVLSLPLFMFFGLAGNAQDAFPLEHPAVTANLFY